MQRLIKELSILKKDITVTEDNYVKVFSDMFVDDKVALILQYLHLVDDTEVLGGVDLYVSDITKRMSNKEGRDIKECNLSTILKGAQRVNK